MQAHGVVEPGVRKAQSLLHRVASTSDIAFYVNQIGDLLSLEQQILSTKEFFTNG